MHDGAASLAACLFSFLCRFADNVCNGIAMMHLASKKQQSVGDKTTAYPINFENGAGFFVGSPNCQNSSAATSRRCDGSHR